MWNVLPFGVCSKTWTIWHCKRWTTCRTRWELLLCILWESEWFAWVNIPTCSFYFYIHVFLSLIKFCLSLKIFIFSCWSFPIQLRSIFNYIDHGHIIIFYSICYLASDTFKIKFFIVSNLDCGCRLLLLWYYEQYYQKKKGGWKCTSTFCFYQINLLWSLSSGVETLFCYNFHLEYELSA